VSPRRKGLVKTSIIKAHNIIINPVKSFVEKYGWKGILSLSEAVPAGLLDPVW